DDNPDLHPCRTAGLNAGTAVRPPPDPSERATPSFRGAPHAPPPELSPGPRGGAAEHDGRLLATAGVDQTIKLWDPDGGHVLPSLEGHGDKVVSLAFSPDGRRLASSRRA